MKRRLITSTGPTITLHTIPDSLIEIVKIPKALLTPVNRKRVEIYEAVMKYQLFGMRPLAYSWGSVSLEPQDRGLICWTRCETCSRPLYKFGSIFEACPKCRLEAFTVSLWGE